ncbi:MAG TPA: DUF2812 domain-containing protein, partial [Candidatus Butyricicoccus avicola]|nr:DUF2812 domain-containing protein [Candidatus Butyricicoccus avicola]
MPYGTGHSAVSWERRQTAMRAIRMISTEIYEPCGTEIYLEEMDHQGYHLDAAGKFLFYFDRTEPRDMR